MTMRILKLLSAVGLCTCLPVFASAETSSIALGRSGQLQRALTGTYGELFTEHGPVAATAPVLAVEIDRVGEAPARFLVPGTEDSRIEEAPILFQDSKYNSFVLLWMSHGEEETSLHFADFDGSEWSDVHTLEADGVPVALTGAPWIVESHDTFEIELAEENTISAERRILHLLWQQDSGQLATYYAPLAFVEGQYVGWHSVVELSGMFLAAPEEGEENPEGEEGGSGSFELTDALARTSSLRVAGDDRSILVTFANPASHRLGSLEINPLPLELGFLGDNVREQILALAELYDPNDPSSLSDEIRAGIIIMGQRLSLHEAYGSYVADRVADWILEDAATYGWGGLEDLGNDARALTIDVSNEVYMSTKTDPADPTSEIVEINVAGLFENPEQPDPAQVLDVRVRADRPAPAIGDGPTTVFTSRSGADLLVAWEDAEAGLIHWVESRRTVDDGAWSEPFSLALGESLTVEQAHRLLAARIR